MLLRSIRSRAVTTKQALMPDQSSPNRPFKAITTTTTTTTHHTKPDQHHSKGIALLLLTDDHNPPNPSNKTVIFGTNLRLQIPPSNTQSPSQLELSEDYTCVTSHGPNPKTTHIFDNCIIDNNYFLSMCYTCNKNLQRKNDIYIYRGDKAFCSEHCRNQQMMLDGFH